MSADHLIAMSDDECRARLGRNGVGRLAVTVNALPAIFPVNYATLDGDVVFRTGPGTKLDAALAEAVVAFEIDDIDHLEHTGWSVMVVGVAHTITDPLERERAAALPLTAWAGGDRDRFVRLSTTVISGRELTNVRVVAV
jgi:nitroimidazol reductase NimA-like FMN-containing flavoprotein (pyridoxamine 5'-phosphate oxidase superfamily)